MSTQALEFSEQPGPVPRTDIRHRIAAARDKLYGAALATCRDATLAQDLVQETLCKALTKVSGLRDPSCLDAWLRQVMLNAYRSYLRRLREETGQDHEDQIEDTTIAPEELLRRDELVAEVHTAVQRLSTHQRDVLVLVDLKELRYAEAAEHLNVPIGTVMSRLARARVRFKELVTEQRERLHAANSGRLGSKSRPETVLSGRSIA